MTPTPWHLWLGHGVSFWDPRRRCETPECRLRGPLVYRYTNGEVDVWMCLWHRYLVPGHE